MKIALFSDVYLPQIGGVSTATNLIYEKLRERGHEVYVITTTDSEAVAEENIIRIPSLPFFSAKRMAFFCPPSTFRRLKKLNFDIVHSQTEFFMGNLSRRIRKALSIPHIHTYHTLYEDWLKGQLGDNPMAKVACSIARAISTSFCNSADRIIVPTRKTKNVLRSYNVKTSIEILPTGIDLKRFAAAAEDQRAKKTWRSELKIADDAFVLIYVGRISEEKGIDKVLTYLVKLISGQKNLYFVLAGSGPQLDAYYRRVQRLGLYKNIRFVGPLNLESVATFYAMGDSFVSASQSETQGLTYIEAMASGLPILVYDDPCLDGVLQEEKNGLAFSNEKEFQYKLSRLIEDKELRKKLALGAKNTSQSFSVEEFIDQLLLIYEKEIALFKSQRYS